ncbi:MFS transporter [Desulfopila sp. IMCC35008]|uniref:MFS transporter n=1 Tax=Desulfopila sp. IMCC35008 TaxID=2653858 RepID=UPI0013D4D1F1|nr:MFS transporter [Desulfopila sp. IMCC35008]
MKSLPAATYRWIIVLAGMLGLMGALGLGRFSLGMMLPSMGEGLGLTYGQMGIISTANFCGYLIAVIGCGSLNSRLGPRLLIFFGLSMIGGSMILIGMMDSFLPILVLYSLTGVGSALANIPIMSLMAIWFEPEIRGRAAGLCVAGNGLGILASGRLVPVMNMSERGWQASWLVLGGVVAMIGCICFVLIRNRPVDGGSWGTKGGGPAAPKDRKPAPKSMIYLTAMIYFLFGFTYVIYITFFVTSLVQERGFTEQAAGILWAWGGLLSIISGPLFGYFSDKVGRKQALMVVFSIQALAYLSAALTGYSSSVYFSVFFFSLVAFSVPTIVAALVGDLAGPQKTASVFGFVTFVFGLGQIAGPAVAGTIAQYSSGFGPAFILASILTVVGVILSGCLKNSVNVVRKSG